MGRLTWVDSDIWNDIRRLDIQLQNLYLRLLCNENGNIAGYYKLNVGHLAYDMRMEEDELIGILKSPQKYWMFDERTEQVLIPKYTKYNKVTGPKQIAKLNADLSKLTPCWLHQEFLIAFEECSGIGSSGIIDEKFRRFTDI